MSGHLDDRCALPLSRSRMLPTKPERGSIIGVGSNRDLLVRRSGASARASMVPGRIAAGHRAARSTTNDRCIPLHRVVVFFKESTCRASLLSRNHPWPLRYAIAAGAWTQTTSRGSASSKAPRSSSWAIIGPARPCSMSCSSVPSHSISLPPIMPCATTVC